MSRWTAPAWQSWSSFQPYGFVIASIRGGRAQWTYPLVNAAPQPEKRDGGGTRNSRARPCSARLWAAIDKPDRAIRPDGIFFINWLLPSGVFGDNRS